MARCTTIFHQMLKLIPRHHFAKLEAEHSTGRKTRSFTRWSQLVHLLSMQLTALSIPGAPRPRNCSARKWNSLGEV